MLGSQEVVETTWWRIAVPRQEELSGLIPYKHAMSVQELLKAHNPPFSTLIFLRQIHPLHSPRFVSANQPHLPPSSGECMSTPLTTFTF